VFLFVDLEQQNPPRDPPPDVGLHDRDDGGRLRVFVFADGDELAAALVQVRIRCQTGQAFVYDPVLVRAEDDAG
jgi:hypothetical protein